MRVFEDVPIASFPCAMTATPIAPLADPPVMSPSIVSRLLALSVASTHVTADAVTGAAIVRALDVVATVNLPPFAFVSPPHATSSSITTVLPLASAMSVPVGLATSLPPDAASYQMPPAPPAEKFPPVCAYLVAILTYHHCNGLRFVGRELIAA